MDSAELLAALSDYEFIDEGDCARTVAIVSMLVDVMRVCAETTTIANLLQAQAIACTKDIDRIIKLGAEVETRLAVIEARLEADSETC